MSLLVRHCPYSYKYYLKYYLTIRDYRKDKKISVKNDENITDQKHFIRLAQLSSLSSNVFKNLLADNLIMGRIEIPLESHDEHVNQENVRIAFFQKERCNLIETILYQDSIDKLLHKWQDIIKKMASEAIPKKTGIQWLASWSSHLEIYLNNYQCSGIWYQDFLFITNLNDSPTQRLIAYLLLQNVIKLTFSKKTTPNSIHTHFLADSYLEPEKILVLEPAEALKFSYIIGWVIYKLTKSDKITRSHPKFDIIRAHLMILSSKQVVYEKDVRSQTTNVVPGQDFLKFMYKMESLIILLFEKHKELGPNILHYINNSLMCNSLLLGAFNALLNISSQMLSIHEPEKQELKDDAKNFLYERIISIYMKSRQKSWRKFNDLIPEKGTSSLRENLKAMRNDIQNSSKTSKTKNTHTLMKKSNVPKDPILALVQLQIWAKLDGAEEEFSKMFLVSELQWLLWAFGDKARYKKKKSLIFLILDHLKKETPFSNEAISKGQIFVE